MRAANSGEASRALVEVLLIDEPENGKINPG
jgi:hypothetical protein